MLRILRAYNVDVSFPSDTLIAKKKTNQLGSKRLLKSLESKEHASEPTLHPSHSFFTLLLTFIPLERSGLIISSPGLLSSFPSVLHIAGPCNDEPLRERASKVALEAVVSARGVHEGREARNDGNRKACWECGKVGRLRMAVIAAFAARGWSMVWFSIWGLGLRFWYKKV